MSCACWLSPGCSGCHTAPLKCTAADMGLLWDQCFRCHPSVRREELRTGGSEPCQDGCMVLSRSKSPQSGTADPLTAVGNTRGFCCAWLLPFILPDFTFLPRATVRGLTREAKTRCIPSELGPGGWGCSCPIIALVETGLSDILKSFSFKKKY